MEKFLAILIFSLLVVGCTVNDYTASDGTTYTMVEVKGEAEFTRCTLDEFWYDTVEFNKPPVAAIADCYARKQTYQLCNHWDYAYQNFYYNEEFVMLLRNSISQALIRKSENPLKCRNTSNDELIRAKIEIELANQRANNAKARAAAEKRRAKKKERCLRAAEQGRTKAYYC